jgi:tape measure domain-containing protein
MTEEAKYKITLDSSKFQSGLKKTEKDMDHFEGKINQLGASIASAFAVGSIVSFGAEAFKTSARMESLKNSIIFASGSAKEGAENLQFLKDVSKEMGLDLVATTEGFRTFSGALIGSRFEGEKARKIFHQISTGIATMGLSADDAKGAFLAIGQMVSKGTVSAEELRGQLGERLPGAFQIAARSLGVTTKQLGDMLKAGEVITEDFLPKFADEMEKTFAGGVAKAAQSQQADLNMLENKWHHFKDMMGNIVAPVVHALAKENESLSDKFFKQKDAVADLDLRIKPLIDRYKDLSHKVGLSKNESEELKNITQTLAQAMPGAVLEWNRYGEAVELSAWAMGKLVAKNKEALALINAKAIAEKEDELHGFARRAMTLQGILKAGSASTSNSPEQDAVMRQAASELRGLTGEGGIIDALRGQLDNLKGGGKLSELQEGIKARDQKLVGGLTPGDAGTSTSGGKSGKGSNSAGVEKIAAGTRNVTLNIAKLIGEINYERWSGNPQDLTEAVRKAVLTAVNDVNIQAQ